jgi:TolB-like protein
MRVRSLILAAAVGTTALLATLLLWKRDQERTESVGGTTAGPPVIALTWRAVGRDVEPWSGLGLGEEVRRALTARGLAVSPDPGPGEHPVEDSTDLAALGRAQKATYALGGTVSRKGSRSEIGMRLIRVQDGSALWNSIFWRDQGNLATLASDLAIAVAQVVGSDVSRTARRPP